MDRVRKASPHAEPKRLGVPLRKQQASEWCWAAVSQAVDRYFDQASDLTQCQIVSRGFKRACCGDDHAPVRNPECNRPGYLHEALERLGLLAKPNASAKESWIKGAASFEVIRREIDHGLPVCVLIRWRAGGRGHFILIEGYSVSAKNTPYVFVRNPLSPKSSSHHPYDVMASDAPGDGYQDGQGIWAYSFLVKPREGKA